MLAADAGVAAEVSVGCDHSLSITESSTSTSSKPIQRVSIDSIVFVDSSVDQFEALADGIADDAEIVLLQPGNALLQISAHLETRTEVNSLQFVAHGKTGQIRLGGQAIDANTLRENESLISDWAKSLSANADILLYSCETGSQDAGTEFLVRLAELTGADVAASIDKTGNSVRDQANWVLEKSVGVIETALAVDQRSRVAFTTTLASAIIPEIQNQLPTGFLPEPIPQLQELGANSESLNENASQRRDDLSPVAPNLTPTNTDFSAEITILLESQSVAILVVSEPQPVFEEAPPQSLAPDIDAASISLQSDTNVILASATLSPSTFATTSMSIEFSDVSDAGVGFQQVSSEDSEDAIVGSETFVNSGDANVATDYQSGSSQAARAWAQRPIDGQIPTQTAFTDTVTQETSEKTAHGRVADRFHLPNVAVQNLLESGHSGSVENLDRSETESSSTDNRLLVLANHADADVNPEFTTMLHQEATFRATVNETIGAASSATVGLKNNLESNRYYLELIVDINNMVRNSELESRDAFGGTKYFDSISRPLSLQ